MWNAAQEAELKARYAAGDSFEEMSGPISKLGTMKSRNACIGKADRLVVAGKLEERGDAVGKANVRRLAAAAGRRTQQRIRSGDLAPSAAQRRGPVRPANADPLPPKVLTDQTGGATPMTARPWIQRVNGECRWPIGEPSADMLMCCGRAGYGPDDDYCLDHYNVGWPPKHRREG